MEAAGLIFAMVVAMLMVYVLPARSRRRYVVVSSREADRFSDGLVLLQDSGVGLSPSRASGRSAGPLLPNEFGRSVVEGTGMSEQTPKAPKVPARPRGTVSVGDRQAVREYSALRAKRAARISSESYAAKRRLLTAGVSVAATLLVVALAGFGIVAWFWVALPGAFLAITLVTSAIAGERTKKQTEAENERLAELRAIIRGEAPKSDDDSEVKSASSSPLHKVGKESVREVASGGEAERQLSSAEVLTAQEHDDQSPLRGRASAKLKEALESKGLSNPVVDAAASEGEAHQERHEPSLDEDPDPRLASVSGSQWDYVPLPAPTYSRKPRLRTRVVHPDTDIVSIKPLEDVAVPGRPVRVSVASRTTTEEELSALETASNPTFKFDLDAVLEQRRAQ